MVFSLFRKKNPQPSKKPDAKSAPAKPTGAKPSVPPVSSAPSIKPAAAVVDEQSSLDFTGYTPAPKQKSAASPAPVPAPARDLDASAVSTPRTQREPDSVMSIEVTEPSGDVAPVIEETAILFANGQADQALAKLSHAVRDEDVGASAVQYWLMLFDLYQHLGMRDDFESLALEFAVKFERSAPAWRDGEARSSPALLTGGTGYCAFTGTLSAASGADFEKLHNLAQKLQVIRADFGKVQEIEASGAERLREALVELRLGGKDVLLTGEAQLFKLLEDACRAGAKTDQALWGLLFEVYRWYGQQERFEEAAVNYAVAFEVSPPSWEARPAARAKPRDLGATAEVSNQALVLSGDVTGAGEALAKELRDWATANSMLIIDMSKVRRVDFVSAGVMLNALSQLRQAGTTIQVRGANEMIVALFEVMGIQKVASVIRRK